MTSPKKRLEVNVPSKQKLCVHYGRYGHCVFGHRCRYAHSVEELANPNALLDHPPPLSYSTVQLLPSSTTGLSSRMSERPILNRAARRPTGYSLSLPKIEERVFQSGEPGDLCGGLWTSAEEETAGAAGALLPPQPLFEASSNIDDFSLTTDLSSFDYPRQNYRHIDLDQFSSNRTMLEESIKERLRGASLPNYEDYDNCGEDESSGITASRHSSSNSIEEIMALLEQARLRLLP